MRTLMLMVLMVLMVLMGWSCGSSVVMMDMGVVDTASTADMVLADATPDLKAPDLKAPDLKAPDLKALQADVLGTADTSGAPSGCSTVSVSNYASAYMSYTEFEATCQQLMCLGEAFELALMGQTCSSMSIPEKRLWLVNKLGQLCCMGGMNDVGGVACVSCFLKAVLASKYRNGPMVVSLDATAAGCR